MSAYVISEVDVHDAAGFEAYRTPSSGPKRSHPIWRPAIWFDGGAANTPGG